MKKRYLLLFLFVPLLGAGCIGQQPVAEPVEQVVIKKQPEGQISAFEQALNYCERQGNRIIFEYDNEQQDNIAYCVFSNSTGCEVADYYTGRCTRGADAVPVDVPDMQDVLSIRECTTEEVPVCGVDGNTYLNSCIAQLQGIRVSHDGACALPPGDVVAVTVEEEQKIAKLNTSIKQSKTQPQVDDNGIPSWLNIVMGITGQTSGVSAQLERCSVESKTTYYFVEDCPNCFSTLYKPSGEVICHPHNDMNNACPDTFDINKRGTYCSEVWKR